MKSKTADSWAELDREIDEVIAKLNAEQPELDLDKLLAVSEEEGKALLASLEAEPLPELDLDLELNNLDKLLAASEEWGDLTPLVLTDKKSVSVRPYVARLPRHLSPSHRIWRALAGHQMMIKQLLYN
ncbi:Uncharacterised protein [Klebsiella pneumoniae]|nr:Uncharacterised protein [Klebsiella pneumoniae]